jgi:hypothetical protein
MEQVFFHWKYRTLKIFAENTSFKLTCLVSGKENINNSRFLSSVYKEDYSIHVNILKNITFLDLCGSVSFYRQKHTKLLPGKNYIVIFNSYVQYSDVTGVSNLRYKRTALTFQPSYCLIP